MRRVTEAIWSDLHPVSAAFTTSQVAEVAGVSLSNASRDLASLAKRGMVTRVKRGVWATTSHPDFSPYAVVPFLFKTDTDGYVSLSSALSLHGMISQIPHTIHVMALSQRRKLETPVGTYEFHKLAIELFGGYSPYRRLGNFLIATPEKTLFDTLYLSARRGQRFSYLPELDLPSGFAYQELEKWIARIGHSSLRSAVKERWFKLREVTG